MRVNSIIRVLGVAISAPQLFAFAVAEEPAAPTDEHVLVGTKANFDEALTDTKYNLVEFYAPWCGHCKALAEPYGQAAGILKEKGADVKLIKVDATDETDLADRFQVQGYPTLLWFVNGISSEYEGPRTAQGIVDWIEEHMLPSLRELKTQEELDEVIKNRGPSEGLFIFKGDEKALKGLAADAAEEVRGLGASYFFPDSTASLTVYTGQDESTPYSESFDGLADKSDTDKETFKKDIVTWVKKARVPLFGQITEDNYEIYVDVARNGMFWVCLNPENLEGELKKYVPVFKGAAKDHAEKAESEKEVYPMVWIDAKEFEAHAKEELGCTTFPTIVLQKGDLLGDAETTKVDKFVRSFSSDASKLDQSSVLSFFDDIKSGALAPVEEPDELDELDEDDEAGEDDEDKELDNMDKDEL